MERSPDLAMDYSGMVEAALVPRKSTEKLFSSATSKSYFKIDFNKKI